MPPPHKPVLGARVRLVFCSAFVKDNNGSGFGFSERELGVIDFDPDRIAAQGSALFGDFDIGQDTHVEQTLARTVLCMKDLFDSRCGSDGQINEVGGGLVVRVCGGRIGDAQTGAVLVCEELFEESGEALHGVIGEGVLEVAGLLLGGILFHAQDLVKELEEYLVSAVDFAGGDFALFGDGDVAVALIDDEAELCKSHKGRANGACLNVTCVCDIAYPGNTGLGAQQVSCFEVIFEGGGEVHGAGTLREGGDCQTGGACLIRVNLMNSPDLSSRVAGRSVWMAQISIG